MRTGLICRTLLALLVSTSAFSITPTEIQPLPGMPPVIERHIHPIPRVRPTAAYGSDIDGFSVFHRRLAWYSAGIRSRSA